MPPRAAALAILLPLAACTNPAPAEPDNATVSLRNLAATAEARARPAGFQVQGHLIPTPSDTSSRYYLLRERTTLGGTIIAIVRQERGDRVAYARTETDCGRRLFHIVGTGPTRGTVETDVAHDGPLRPIAGLPLRQELASFVCGRAKTPLAEA